MLSGRTLWLAVNASSGSNDEAALAVLREAFGEVGCTVARTVSFPEDDPPTPAELDGAGIDLLAVFTGDGSLNAIVTALYGWRGSVLVLPGGTMNLLSQRLHGEADAAAILQRACAERARSIRPPIVRTRYGDGLTGVLAGPGTAWNNVREAMRESDVLGMISTATEAIGESAGGPKVVCSQSSCGRAEGYSLIMLTPTDAGLEGDGYYAETIADYAKQGIALLRRNFRDGPHEGLGLHREIELTCPEGGPMGLLIDGEPADGEVTERFTVARCEVDLLATIDG
jgi:hypothetical protein